MSRKTQVIQSTGTDLHVYNRGVDRSVLFPSDKDFEFFLSLLSETLGAAELELLAFTLMPNHFHLIVHQHSPYAISEYMRSVCHRYACGLNGRRGRTGHLFGSRYKVGRIKSPQELLHTSHYIYWNPVRAGLASGPSAWKFSSFREYVEGTSPSFVSQNRILSLVGGREEYLKFLREYDPSRPGTAQHYLKPPGGGEAVVFGQASASGLLSQTPAFGQSSHS